VANTTYPAMLVGLGLVALWVDVRLPSRRPKSISRAFGHLVLSFAVLVAMPALMQAFLAVSHTRTAGLVFVVTALMPATCYLLLSWIWLLGTIVRMTGGPRGGHRVRAGAR
jgi:hypothetical protein